MLISSSFDIKDFSLGFIRGLSIEDGTATLTEFTGRIIEAGLLSYYSHSKNRILRVCWTTGYIKINNKSIIRFWNKYHVE